jgi:uncharacterized protein (TIGR02302 family)
MTHSSPPTESQTGSEKLKRFLWVAWTFAAFERLWPRLWPASGIAGLFAALALSGLLPLLPWPLHALILAAVVSALALTLHFSLRRFSWPARREGARKLERDSGLNHRPISEADDTLAVGGGNAVSEALWRAHRQRRIDPAQLRLALPTSALAMRDPKGLRFVVLALIGFGLIFSWGGWGTRFASAFGPAAYADADLDAWIDPPAYTGEAPVYLTDRGTLAVPAGSTLNLRVHGVTRAPYLSMAAAHFPFLAHAGLHLDGAGGEYVGRTELTEDVRIRLRADGRSLGKWNIRAVPDLKPAIRFAAKPARGEREMLKLSYAAHDDYGVTHVRAFIRPADGNGKMLTLDLDAPPGKDVAQTVYRDLTDQPYAGGQVDIVLVASDASGNIALTEPERITLPALHFTDPLAKALIEVRRDLATRGLAAKGKAAIALDAFTLAPERYFEGRMPIYLSLRSAFWGTQSARHPDDLSRIEALLWQTAAALEHAGVLPLAEALRRQQQEIAHLIASGASPDEIDAALGRYARLLQQYLQALARAAPTDRATAETGTKMLEPKDLAALMAAIQEMTQAGDRTKAVELLAFLQNLVENLKMAGGSSAPPPGDRALKALSDLMGRQRLLLDKTFRESQHAGDPKDGGAKGLAKQQGALKDELSEALKGQKKPQGNLKHAEILMGQARDALAIGDLPRAGTLQKYALEALRKAAGAIANGKPNPAGNADPFGRKADAGGGTGDGDTKVPDSSTLRRARDILIELRKRAGETNRPKDERDYIDRLLKQF